MDSVAHILRFYVILIIIYEKLEPLLFVLSKGYGFNFQRSGYCQIKLKRVIFLEGNDGWIDQNNL